MSQEDRKLFLIDLCARLPYDIKVTWDNKHPLTVTPYTYCVITNEDNINKLPKIFLRPMSSMTEEEKEELKKLINEKLNRNIGQDDDEWTPWVLYDTTGIKNYIGEERFYFDEMSFIYDWLNAHYFDYRGLIEKGLALEASKDMYNKEK